MKNHTTAVYPLLRLLVAHRFTHWYGLTDRSYPIRFSACAADPANVELVSQPCIVSFNIISIPEHPIVLGLPWFKLNNPDKDWRTREIRYRQTRGSTHKIATISLHQLREEGRKEEMFLFAVSIKPSNTTNLEESTVQLPEKYRHYANVFDKVQANTLPHHQPYDCPIDLQQGKEPPWGPIYN